MLFAKIKNSNTLEYEKELIAEMKRVIESRSFFDYESDNPFAFGIRDENDFSNANFAEKVESALLKFVPSFVSSAIDISIDNGKCCANVSGYLQNKYISFSHIF